MDRPFVIDGVCHPYNFSPANTRGRFGEMFSESLYSYFPYVNPPEIQFPKEAWLREWQPEEFIETMLLESHTDMLCVHSLPIYDAYEDGLAAHDKCARLKRDYPDRVLWYGGVNLCWPERADRDLEAHLAAGCDGIKFYPARYDEGRTRYWRMDDEELAFPMYERILDAGINNVAVHKALPLGPVSVDSMRVDDISTAANVFPDLNIQIVHAGFMFVDETKFLIANHPNVYATLEASTLFCMLHPPTLTRMLDEFLIYGGPDKLIYASAAVNPHPRVVLESFADYTLPAESPIPLNDEVRAAFLGGNLARLHGIDVDERRRRLADDRFAREVVANGLRPHWQAVHGADA
ncbi:amidohydrolase 2 [Salinisphaera sp. PC39]|uniref:amidohydrolase family protein n=1 Tax=Salinisphaera sp. PC39 TaxID=1304156 RepID=UPI003342DCE9